MSTEEIKQIALTTEPEPEPEPERKKGSKIITVCYIFEIIVYSYIFGKDLYEWFKQPKKEKCINK